MQCMLTGKVSVAASPTLTLALSLSLFLSLSLPLPPVHVSLFKTGLSRLELAASGPVSNKRLPPEPDGIHHKIYSTPSTDGGKALGKQDLHAVFTSLALN